MFIYSEKKRSRKRPAETGSPPNNHRSVAYLARCPVPASNCAAEAISRKIRRQFERS